MKKGLLLCLLLISNFIVAQQRYTLSGVITDITNGEKLLGVTFVIKELETGTTTKALR